MFVVVRCRLLASIRHYSALPFYLRKAVILLGCIAAALCLYWATLHMNINRKSRYIPQRLLSQNILEPKQTKQRNSINIIPFINESSALLDQSYSVYPEYLIHTEQCVIPKFPLFDSDTIKLYKSYHNKVYHCNRTDISDQFQRINYTSVQFPLGIITECSAREVLLHSNADGEDAKYGRVVPKLSLPVHDFPDFDAVEVKCNRGHKKVIPLVPRKQPFKWSDIPGPRTLPQNPVNILMIGLDSVSRLNFLRHMKQTSKLLDQHGFLSMYGHHKIGDNTLPNLFGMFLGEKNETWWAKLPPNNKLDALPFIFKKYSNAGYLTTYIEDYPEFGLFSSHGIKGFTGQPTEYYLRPMNVLVQRDGLYDRMWCYGNKLEMEHYYEYILDQLSAFKSRNQHHLTWIHQSMVSHGEMNHCQYMDHPVHRLLSQIFSNNYHQNSVIMFYSDHAIRFGKILETDSGFHETRLPFLYIYVPESLKIQDFAHNLMNLDQIKKILALNSHQLTSHMDIHATLMHLLTGAPSSDEPYGVSLFTPISPSRTCAQAGVPAEYCLCKRFVNYSNRKISKALAQHVIEHINAQLEGYQDYCTAHALNQVISAKIAYDDDEMKAPESKAMVALVFTTTPGGAKFDATVQTVLLSRESGVQKRETHKIMGKIVRIDRYAEKAECVKNFPIESFCICRETLATVEKITNYSI